MIFQGNIKYHIKGCSGQGGFAQVYKAYVDGNPEDVVALKVNSCHHFSFLTLSVFADHSSLHCSNLLQIQKPAYPWEFHMYRQLDQRVSAAEVFYCLLNTFKVASSI